MTEKALAVWDITQKCTDDNFQAIKDVLQKIAKKWVFQQEEGGLPEDEVVAAAAASVDTKAEEKKPYRHWQIRLSLVKRLRNPWTRLKGTALENAHWSPTTRGQRDGFNYVMKAATRIAGPWRDGIDEEKAEEPEEIKGKTARMWQNTLRDLILRKMTDEDRRKVDILFDPVGGIIGKSFVRKACMWHRWAEVIPYFTEMKETMSYVMDRPSNAYLIDLPRDALAKKTKEFWAGIENLKDGRAYDTRYKFRDRVFDNPKVWILTNKLPDKGSLSEDRWRIWMVHPKTDDLVDVTHADDAVYAKIQTEWQKKKDAIMEPAKKKQKRTLADFDL